MMTMIVHAPSENSSGAVEHFLASVQAFNSFMSRCLTPITVSSKRPQFAGRIRMAESEGVRCFDITATDHVVQRTDEDIRATGSGDFYLLSMVLTNSCTILQDGREATLQAGDLCIFDTTRPYTIVSSNESRLIILMFPRSILPIPPTSVRDVTAVRLEGSEGFRPIVSAILLSLIEHLDQFATPTGHRLAYNVVDVVSTMLADAIQTEVPMENSGTSLTRICEYIEDRLADPGLSLREVAAAHYVSTRYVQAQFQRRNTTITRWIRQRRLEMCRRDLSDPMLAGHSVAEIAARWGFAEPSYFSKVFKEKYNCSPTSFRSEYSRAA